MSNNRIVFATGNEGKMKEIRLILADLGMEILSMKEAGADPVIVENGKTFGENAEIKAQLTAKVNELDGAVARVQGMADELDANDAPAPQPELA